MGIESQRICYNFLFLVLLFENQGGCYNLGKGVKQDFEEAVKYYKLSADQGFANAQCNLGISYRLHLTLYIHEICFVHFLPFFSLLYHCFILFFNLFFIFYFFIGCDFFLSRDRCLLPSRYWRRVKPRRSCEILQTRS